MEEKLVSEYIGENADKYMTSNTNWAAAILGEIMGPVWFFYRKSYLLGFAFIIFSLIVSQIAGALGIGKAYYIMFFVYLFSANKLYIWDVKRKVNKIIKANVDMSDDELVNLVKQKGGTNVAAAVIYVMIFILLCVLVIIGFIMVLGQLGQLLTMSY